MTLTTAQETLLKNDILADPVLGALPASSDVINQIINAYKQPENPTFLVWNSAVPVDTINDAVDVSKYTPADAPDGTAAFTNRVLACQTKLMALQNYLFRANTINAEKPTIRAGLRDSVIQIPGGTGGTMVQAAGAIGVNVMNACTRSATRLEKLLVARTESTGTVTAGICGATGVLSYEQVRILMGW